MVKISIPVRLAIAAMLFTLAAALFAQTTTGRISGTVTDSSGAVIPGASITVTNEGTRLTWTARANDHGFYVVPLLPVGTYSAEADVPGFQKARKTGYALDADARLTADFTLSPSQVNEQIQVTDVAGETVNATSGEIGRVVDSAQVEELALNGRNYMQLVTLVPGVALLDEDQMALTTSLATTQQVINGNRSNSNNLSVDGGYNMDSGSNASQINNVGVDFIKEVKVQTSNFSAEYGRQSGAAINVVTKSGENAFHGSLFETLRNDKLDARNYFAPRKGQLRFNNFGWSAGGPVLRHKLFFFGGQEYKRIRRDTEPVRRSLPLRSERRGDFTVKNSSLYYPGTNKPVPGKNIASLITPEGRSIVKVFDALEAAAASYSDTLGGNNAVYQVSNPFNAREDMVRLDYRMTERHSFYMRYLHDAYDLVDPFGTGSGSQLPSVPTNNQRPGTSAQFAHTALFASSLVNEAKLNAVWSRQTVVPIGDGWKRDTYGFTYPQLYPGGLYPDGIPAIEISGLSYLKGPSFAATSAFTDVAFHDNLTWVRGRHTFKTGIMVIRDRKDQNGKSVYTGKVEFSNKGNSNTTGNPTADALLGNFRAYSEAAQDPYAFFRYSQVEGFVMDSWKTTRRLSLEMGLRWHWFQPAYTQANNIVNFDPAYYDPARAVTVERTGFIVPGSGFLFNGLVRAGGGVPSGELARVPGGNTPDVLSVRAGAPRGFYDPAHLFAPRFGFAYAPGSRGRTTIRGGFGMYYNRPEVSMITPAVNVPPYLQTVQIENGNLASPSGGTAAALSPIDNIQAIDRRLKTTYTMNFSLSIQRELPRGVFLETAYVGNLGRHLQRQPDINQPTFEDYMAIAPIPSSQRPPVNAFRRYRGFSAINMRISDSNSNYNALQVYATKRKGSLVMTASYTWSKALADASKNSEDPEDPFNRKFNYGPATFDRRHILLTTWTYKVPLFKRMRGVPGAALKGWEASGIVRAQSGPYLSVTCDSVAGVRRADYLGGPAALPSDERSADHWFNTSAFVAAPIERRGNAGVGIVQAPGLYVWDASLRKQVRLSERFGLRLQTDFFNAFNHANFRNLSAKTSSKNFGQLSEAGPGRNIQFGLKLQF